VYCPQETRIGSGGEKGIYSWYVKEATRKNKPFKITRYKPRKLNVLSFSVKYDWERIMEKGKRKPDGGKRKKHHESLIAHFR
jgi:hypothetical protein